MPPGKEYENIVSQLAEIQSNVVSIVQFQSMIRLHLYKDNDTGRPGLVYVVDDHEQRIEKLELDKKTRDDRAAELDRKWVRRTTFLSIALPIAVGVVLKVIEYLTRK